MSSITPIRVTVLLSGSGTTFEAIRALHDTVNGSFEITDVVSDNDQAFGLQRAQKAGIATHCVSYKSFDSRQNFNLALLECVSQCQPDLVVLAGFMRIVDAAFVDAFDGKLINIHPSLLPKFPGLNTYRRALDKNETQHGSTVHFVNDILDGGPLIAQAQVNIDVTDNVQTLSAKVQRVERILYPIVINWFAQKRLVQRDGKAWLDGIRLDVPRRFDSSALEELALDNVSSKEHGTR